MARPRSDATSAGFSVLRWCPRPRRPSKLQPKANTAGGDAVTAIVCSIPHATCVTCRRSKKRAGRCVRTLRGACSTIWPSVLLPHPYSGMSAQWFFFLGKGTGCALVWPRPSAGSSRIACSNGHMSRPQRPTAHAPAAAAAAALGHIYLSAHSSAKRTRQSSKRKWESATERSIRESGGDSGIVR